MENKAVEKTLICFTKLCVDNKVFPCFRTWPKGELEQRGKFFSEMQERYPEIFELYGFDKNGHVIYSERVEREIDHLRGEKLILGYEYNHAYYETSRKLLERYKNISNTKVFNKIAKEFYDKFLCNRRGEIGKHNLLCSIENLF